MQKYRLIFLTAIGAALIFSFQNCSEVQFTTAEGTHFINENLNKDGILAEGEDMNGHDDESTEDSGSSDDSSTNDESSPSNESGTEDEVAINDGSEDNNSSGESSNSDDEGGDSNNDSGDGNAGDSVSGTDGSGDNTDNNSQDDNANNNEAPGASGEDVDADGDHDHEDDLAKYACGGNDRNPKVLVCHVPSGNPSNSHNICISRNALDAHINKHGGDQLYDYYGECK